MIKVFILSIFLLTDVYAYNSNWVCMVQKAPALYKRVLKVGGDDQVKHCVFSCSMALSCGAVSTMQLGVLKELIDLLGFGSSELKDIKANIYGIRLAYSGQAKSYQECAEECPLFYNY